ncbi:MAG: hypothetical protein DKM50_12800 [Candidatus Margulisiibacteriota bacterium]|nr:MAG: hypothetical protein A2X43_01220 [Candidatus Margulisbacteria bacterium GWD2_39_127]OGI05361.1 MAG: hypothetical protein A2X42_05910 [Candidatus Margulisbacteria bacterium GWF2_38_17]OGI05818.1 MAG: hypothetical protein A2X41_02770 [Candidatus Margulisbacteria bacterium GWE2_39_32]PZM77413.1 MAG: hypothetical protein DKM50_12800 [Candidatus Margulisiibacteriota bacterium]HAR62278.1 hypothetical protein [Candidatus Margulisiibacteriota bacterium]
MVLDLKIDVKREQNVPVITLAGEVDVYTYPQLKTAISDIIETGEKDMIINLEGVKYIDSTGLGVLASGANKLAKNNGFINIICTKPQIKKIFEVSGLTQANFRMFDDEKVAILEIKKDSNS